MSSRPDRARHRCLPVFHLTGDPLFPGDVRTLAVRRDDNHASLLSALEADEPLVMILIGPPRPNAQTSAVAITARVLRLDEAGQAPPSVSLQGLERVRPADLREEAGHFVANAFGLPECGSERRRGDTPEHARAELDQLITALRSLHVTTPEARALVQSLPHYGHDPARISDLAATLLPLRKKDKQQLLEEPEARRRVSHLCRIIELRRAEAAPIERERTTHEQDVERLSELVSTVELSEAAERAALRELEHYRRAARGSAESARSYAWLEWMLELPWKHTRRRGADERRFARVLGALRKSHVGLEDVKQRVVEYLAVRMLGGGRAGGTVLCFVGPPGTGKSSMGETIARALGRACVTIPVGAFTEEGELAGLPRRADAGAPGAVLAGLHRAACDDPVVLLDEVDKLRLGGEGTSAGALLHLLDPEQNARFLDRYLGTPFDLSRCLFLATANDATEVPEALLDRMETIEFPGYGESEKLKIAKRHLIPRARQHAGVSARQFRITPAALEVLIRGYTEEAGVRDLSRRITALARKAAVSVVNGGAGLAVRKLDLLPLLGPRTTEEELRLRRPVVGVAMGLAWTSIGGALLPVESIAVPGTGRLTLTGQVGEVLRESAQTALTLVRSRLRELELDPAALDELDLHLHFPGAATPKEGPSAGVAIVAAVCSLLSEQPVRHDLAMTGEVSLLGQVLPVGGVREKLLAAVRAGISEVAIPRANADEAMRLPADARRRLTIHLIADVYDLLDLAMSPAGKGDTVGTRGARNATASARARRRKEGRQRD